MAIKMRIFGAVIFGLISVFGCGGNTGEAPALAGQVEEGGAMIRLERFDVIDYHGFGQPVTVVSFLAPADWRLEGGVQWNFNTNTISGNTAEWTLLKQQ